MILAWVETVEGETDSLDFLEPVEDRCPCVFGFFLDLAPGGFEDCLGFGLGLAGIFLSNSEFSFGF